MSARDGCDECGYVYDVPRHEIPSLLLGLGGRYGSVLASHGREELRRHNAPGRWSPLEYCCHMRDVLCVQRDRVLLALREEEPVFASMRREERVTEERYNDQDPEDVAVEISRAAEAL